MPRRKNISIYTRRKTGYLARLAVVAAGLILVVAVILFAISRRSKNDGDLKGSFAENSGTVSNLQTASQEAASSKAAEIRQELSQWYMKLASPSSPIEQDYSPPLSAIKSDYNGKDYTQYFDSRAIELLHEMCAAARKDKIYLTVISAHRTIEKQTELYNNKITALINQGDTLDVAKNEAGRHVAVPGTSEHHLGLAVDFNTVVESFEDTKAFRWLSENAVKYGFIMRYPKDKQDITRITYEPWHYRYVGKEQAALIKASGLCFEEYLEQLTSGK